MQLYPDSELPGLASLLAKPAQDWNRLFIRRSGWTGADGIYSIPLSGKENWTESSTEKTLFLFRRS